ncbi:MAG: phage tail protein [Albidovulum sp.]
MHPIAVLLASVILAATTAAAHADPISVAILTAIGGFAAVTPFAVTLTTALLTTALGVGLQVLSSLLLRKKGPDVGGTTGKLQSGGTVPRSFPIGRTVVSHSLVYANTFGQDGKTPNAYLVQVFALADLPVAGLAEVWVNGTKATWNPGATPATEGIAIPEFAKDGKDYLWVRFYDGTQVTADSRLVTLFGSDPDRPYPATRVGTGVAYAVVVSRYERELFGGFPQMKFILDGVSFYDPREDTTAGGDGAQRWSTPATWSEAPDNPMVAAYNIARGISYDGEWFFGGQTVSSAQLPFAAWNAAMNECDVEFALADSGSPPATEKQFTANGEVRCDMMPADVIEMLLKACNGRMGEVGGVYKPHVGAATAAVMSITDEDILSTEAQTFEPFKNLAEQVNAVTAKYIEPGEGWTAKDAPPLYNAGMEALDGGRRQIADVAYDFVTSGTTVQRLMKAALNEHRRERTHILPLPPDAFVLEPTVDFISWTSTRNGYVNKLFRVDAVQDQENLNLVVNLTEVDPSDYDWDETTDERPIVISPTPLVYPPSQGIAGADIDGVIVEGGGWERRAGALLLWNGTDLDDVRAVAFQIRIEGETDLIYSGETPESAVSEGSYIVTANLVGETAYEGRLRFVPFTGRETTWSDWIDFTTPAVNLPRNSLDPAFSDLMRRVNERLTSIEAGLDDIGSAVQALDSVQVTDNSAVIDRIQRIIARTANTRATVTQVQTVQADQTSALAALGIDVDAIAGTASAGGFLRIAAEVDGDDELSVLKIGVAAERDGTGKTAAIEMAATATDSLLTLIAELLKIKTSGGTTVAEFDTVGGVFSIFGAVFEAGLIRSPDGRFEIDLAGKLLTIKDASDNVVLRLGYY